MAAYGISKLLDYYFADDEKEGPKAEASLMAPPKESKPAMDTDSFEINANDPYAFLGRYAKALRGAFDTEEEFVQRYTKKDVAPLPDVSERVQELQSLLEYNIPNVAGREIAPEQGPRTLPANEYYDEEYFPTPAPMQVDKSPEAPKGLFTRPTANVRPKLRPKLLDFIAKGEGSYDSSNQGTENGKIVGSTHSTERNGSSLSELTIGQIQSMQRLGDEDPNQLFAVGKYQLIPDTLDMAVKDLGLSKDTVFNAETQEKLGEWLLFNKRPELGAYIRGEHDNLNLALREAAKEWASLPDPKTGKSYYGKGNKAQHSLAETKRALLAAREEYTK